MRRILARVIRSLGDYEVVEASNGREALAACNGPVEIVITDWSMPGMGGLELVRHLRNDPALSAVRILMVSGRGAEDDVRQAAEAGVDDYILKPFSLDALRAKLERLVQVPQQSVEG